MKIICTKHKPRNKKITASRDNHDWKTDKQYLMRLSDEIETILYEDFGMDVSAYSDGTYIYITMDIDDEDAEEGVITPSDLARLTGDVESDAYQLAEEFYDTI